ncbi:MAG: trypsin-like peptidase domain-containing protein [Chitinophagaceae bacterium]|nr:trypsin-like peptidase domain-containing protein [Chitinophagaceae bacterium]
MHPGQNALYILIILLMACNSPEQRSTEPKTADTLSLADVRIDRYPLPIKNIDSLKGINLNAADYLKAVSGYDSMIDVVEKDTTIPLLARRRKVYDLKSLLGRLKDHAYISKMETICGDVDHMVDIATYNGERGVPRDFVLNTGRSVGMIRWNNDFRGDFGGAGSDEGDVRGVHWGSGSLIGDDLFLTAGHCFFPMVNGWKTPVKNGRALSSKEVARYMNVIFNYQLDPATHGISGDTMSFPIVALVEYDSSLDYAIVRLGTGHDGQLAGNLFGKLKVVDSSYQNRTDTLCIIQHPQGKPKKVDSGPLYYFDDAHLFYNHIDTEGGSSGAPVINYSSGLIEGIHVEGGCSRTSGSNEAVRIQLIEKKSKILNKL